MSLAVRTALACNGSRGTSRIQKHCGSDRAAGFRDAEEVGRLDAGAADQRDTYFEAAGATRVQKSLNSTLSKNADAFTIFPSFMSRNQA